MTVSTDDIDLAALTLGKQKRYGHKSGTPRDWHPASQIGKGTLQGTTVAGILVVLGLGT